MRTSPRKPTRTYTMAAFCAAMDAAGRKYERRGNVVDVDWDRSGHFNYKCTPSKGLYITSSGKGGTLYQLLRDAGPVALSTCATGADTPPKAGGEAKPTGKKKGKDLGEVINAAFPRALPDAIISGTSRERMATRHARSVLEKAHADAWGAVSAYLESRWLTLDDLPAHSRVAPVARGYDLIIPLANSRPDEPSAHFTLITKTGEKRPEAWLQGDCRYTRGPQRTPAGGAAHVIIRASDQKLEIPGVIGGPAYCIGEGLESAGSGHKITGYTSIFAVTRGGVATFLDDEVVVKGLIAEGATLIILVDRDVSGDGQKSAAILARKARKCGIPVMFCVAQEVVKGGSHGADWNDVLMELGLEGARGALLAACAESEAQLSVIHDYQDFNIRPTTTNAKLRRATDTEPSPSIDFRSLSDAATVVRDRIKRHLTNKTGGPLALAISPGAGKSYVLAEECDRLALRYDKPTPTVVITPTRKLAKEAAKKSFGIDAPARSGEKGATGFCNIFPEIKPLSEAWRSIVAHRCTTCVHGESAMSELRREGYQKGDYTDIVPCAYLIQTDHARNWPTLTCTAQKANTDDTVFKMKDGKKWIARRAISDDYSELNDHKMIRQDQISGWVRASSYAITKTAKGIAEVEGDYVDFDITTDELNDLDSGSDIELLKARKTATEALKSGIEQLLQFLAAHPEEAQITLNPADFAAFCKAAEDKSLVWMDGTTAESVHRDGEGQLEIPLRAVRDVANAIKRGAAWGRKGYLHIAVPTFLPSMIKKGGAVLDATLLPHVRMLIEAHGGEVVDVHAADATRVRQHFDGAHTKTSCDPNGKNFAREKRNFLAALKAAILEEGDPGLLCVISHMAFILAITKEIIAFGVPESQIGWFNRHDRGQNDWYESGCTRLVQWGVMRLSSSVAERMYMSDRQVVIEAGGNGGEVFSANRAKKKVYRVPGTDYEKEDAGFVVDDLDRWERSRVTAQTKQAGGRLRGTRRTDTGEKLTHDIHSNFVFSSDHGFRVDEVITDAAFQTHDSLNAGSANDAERRAVIGLSAALSDWALAGRAGKAPGRDKMNGYLKAKKLKEISSHTWKSVSKYKSVQALYNIYMMPARIPTEMGDAAYLTDLYGQSVGKMYQEAVDGILAAGGDPAGSAAIRGYFDKMIDAGEYSSDLDVVEGLLLESAATIQRALATGTGGIS